MKFFDMFEEGSAILNRAASQFLEMVTQFDRLAERSNELKREERAGDEIVERIIKALDRSFITPFDREDIHTLASRIDDVLDNMEETAHRFVIFRIERPTPAAVAMARIVHECCVHLEQSVRLCRTMKDLEQLEHNLKQVIRLE